MKKKTLLNLIIFFSIIGLFTSFYLVQTHYSAKTYCDLNEVVACSVVKNSQFSEIFKVPVAVFGVLWFLFFLGMIWQVRKKPEFPWFGIVAWSIIGLLSVIYFIVAEIILGAICIFCTVVHIIVVILLILSWLLYSSQQPKPSKKVVVKTVRQWLLGAVVVSILLIITFNFLPTSSYDQLAQCFTREGLTVYSSIYCNHCLQQEKLFGDSFQYINKVECHPQAEDSQAELCREKEITGTPTWIMEKDGEEIQRHAGLMTIKQLQEYSGCE